MISMVFFLNTGCEPDGSSAKLPSTTPHLKKENKKATMEVTIGGKIWEIDPNLSYKAVGVWTNPDPRPLTKMETVRLKAIQTEMQTLSGYLDELDKELNFLQRIEKPQIKIQYSFGMPLHLSSGKIIYLGEFPMEMENPTETPTIPSE